MLGNASVALFDCCELAMHNVSNILLSKRLSRNLHSKANRILSDLLASMLYIKQQL